MVVSTTKKGRKTAKNNGVSLPSPSRTAVRTIGAMRERRRETEPSYERLLIRFGLLSKGSGLQTAWGVWQRVCADREMVRLSMALAAKSKPAYMASVAEPFQNGARVLAAMSEWQLSALRQRIGVA